jgi:bacterial/archaeal transporter family protein
MSGWVLPAAGYLLLLGALGVTLKLALRDVEWQQVVLWAPIFYGLFAIGSVVLSGTRLPLGAGAWWALASGFCLAAAGVLIFVALDRGPASQVVPLTSAYPVVTLVGSALFLSEKITVVRGVGTALVVVGVAMLSR